MIAVTIDKSACRGLRACGMCLGNITEEMHKSIGFHGVLLVSETRWNDVEGDRIREAICICGADAIRAERL